MTAVDVDTLEALAAVLDDTATGLWMGQYGPGWGRVIAAALLPVVDRIANQRAAAALEAAANAIEGDGQGGFDLALRRINAVDHLRSTDAALRASNGEGTTT